MVVRLLHRSGFVLLMSVYSTTGATDATDAMFKALATEARRQLLATLAPHGPTEMVTLSDLLEGNDAGTTMVMFHHNHLPMLDELDYIEWDSTRNEVGQGPQFDELVPFLDRHSPHPLSPA